MHPILFEIPLLGGITIYSYGVLVASGFVAGIIWVVHESKRLGYNPANALDLVFYIIIAAILGSRLLFLIVNDPSRLLHEPWSLFMVWEGGLVFFGGLLGSVAVALIYLRRKKLPLLEYVDMFSPAIAIGHMFGRLGCLMAGCCFGRPTFESWYSITFPVDPHSFAPGGVPRYPTQIIESIGNLIIFLILVFYRKHKLASGTVFGLYLILYSILRFFVELLRGDPDRGYIIQDYLSTSQGVSIFLFICGIAVSIYSIKRKRAKNV